MYVLRRPAEIVLPMPRTRGIYAYGMDGARLWEASAAYGCPLADLCALFDSIYVSFYKGLGGLSGAMLMGTTEFISKARIWSRRFGDSLYTQMSNAVSS